MDTTSMRTIWDRVAVLGRLEEERDKKRVKSGRLTYDCFNLHHLGTRAHCAEGMRIGQALDGSMELIAVLRGITSGVCKTCELFNTEE